METKVEFLNKNVLGEDLGRIELIQHVGNDKIVVNAARASYGQDNKSDFSKGDAKLLDFLIEHQHTSVLEHTYVTFVVDAPIFVVRQWMRHRMSSYNEISYRYVEVEDNKFYIPKMNRVQHKKNKQASYMPGETVTLPAKENQAEASYTYDVWNSTVTDIYEQAYKSAYKHYQELLDWGVAREIARAVIPVGQFTRFYYSANLRSLLHFCELRTGEGAQWEIAKYAEAILEALKSLYPNTISAWEKAGAANSHDSVTARELFELKALYKDVISTIDSVSNKLDRM